MENRSEGAAVVVAIGLILILLLAAGGVGVYFLMGRQMAASAMHAERALLAEEEALAQAEHARAEAEAAAAARRRSRELEAPAVEGGSIRAAIESKAVESKAIESKAIESKAIESILRAQEAAWNRGDLEAFMEHYAKSESLTFSSGGKTTRGWTATLKRYRERYPTREKMGRVKLSGLEITPLGDSAALVLGQWRVDRDNEPLSGNFSLVVRQIDGRWLIIHDHTSRLTE